MYVGPNVEYMKIKSEIEILQIPYTVNLNVTDGSLKTRKEGELYKEKLTLLGF